MELWIRSQDRETLIKTENVSIDNENYYIIGNLITDDNKSICDYWRLGHYETKERTLEVLDEIQCKIDYIYELSLRPRALTTIEHKIVYEMPEK